MKILVKESENKEGLEGLMGQRVTLFCCRYIYTGKLVGVSDKEVKLSDGGIVYETGKFSEEQWKDYQPIGKDWFVKLDSIESYGIMK